jgi:hypothetical protein
LSKVAYRALAVITDETTARDERLAMLEKSGGFCRKVRDHWLERFLVAEPLKIVGGKGNVALH